MKRRRLLTGGLAAGAALNFTACGTAAPAPAPLVSPAKAAAAPPPPPPVAPPPPLPTPANLAGVAAFVPAVLGDKAFEQSSRARRDAIEGDAKRVIAAVGRMPPDVRLLAQGWVDRLAAGPRGLNPAWPARWDEVERDAVVAHLNTLRFHEDPQQRRLCATVQGLIVGAHYGPTAGTEGATA